MIFCFLSESWILTKVPSFACSSFDFSNAFFFRSTTSSETRNRVPKSWCFWTVVLKKTLEGPLDSKEIKPVNSKGNQPWINIGRTDADTLVTWCEEPKRPGCWERFRAEGKGDDREWDGWMESLIQWTWVWANSGREWRTRTPGMQRVSYNLVTEQEQMPCSVTY